MKHKNRQLLSTHLNEVATKGFDEILEVVLSKMITAKHSNRLAIAEIALPIIKGSHKADIAIAIGNTVHNATNFIEPWYANETCPSCNNKGTNECGGCDSKYSKYVAKANTPETSMLDANVSRSYILLDHSRMNELNTRTPLCGKDPDNILGIAAFWKRYKDNPRTPCDDCRYFNKGSAICHTCFGYINFTANSPG